MKTKRIVFLIGALLFSIVSLSSYSQTTEESKNSSEEQISDKDKLVVMWTSGDREVALKMVFMYTYNAKKYNWWKDITLLVWGPSSKLLSEDEELQEYVASMKEVGVNLLACKGCADLYGVSDKLEEVDNLSLFIEKKKIYLI